MPNQLDNLCGPGKPLKAAPPDAKEIAGLLRTGVARLLDARNATLALESRFDLAYNAAHALCLAALRHMGYRPGNRYIVFQVLPHTLALGPEVWRLLDKCHNTRNLGEYEGLLDVDEAGDRLDCRHAGGGRRVGHALMQAQKSVLNCCTQRP